MTDTSATGRAGDAEDRWHLEDRRDFLRRSLDDAEREHQAGDLSDDDYLVLRRRDQQQLADVEAALAALGGPDGPAGTATEPDEATDAGAGVGAATGGTGPRAPTGAVPGRPGLVPLVLDDDDIPSSPRKRRIWMALVGVAALVAGAVLLVVHVTSPRLPGQTATGGVKTPQTQTVQHDLAAAATLVQNGKLDTALNVYKEILSVTPRQPQALAEWGWLSWEAADSAGNLTLAAQGRSAVADSVKLDPSLFAGRLYLGSILLAQHQPTQAVVQYKAFLADHPPKSWVTTAAGYISQAFTEAKQPVPAQVKAAAASTSTSTTSTTAAG